MKSIITKIETIQHGIDWPDSFQGCGVSFTSFDNVVTGIGDTEREAFDDCREQMAMNGVDVESFDFSEALSTIDSERSASTSYSDCVEEAPYYYVSIRYNTQSTYKLPDCVNVWLIYASLVYFADWRAEYSTEQAEGGSFWTDAFYAFNDKPEHRNLSDSNPLFLDVSRWLGYGDYMGDLVTESNYRVFTKRYASLRGKAWVEVNAGCDYHAVYLNVAWLISNSDSQLVDDVNDLVTNYPSLDDDELSKLEIERQNEAWDMWARSDFERALEKHLENTVAKDDADDETVFEQVEKIMRDKTRAEIADNDAKGETGFHWLTLREGETEQERFERALSSTWFELFNTLMEKSNTYWEIEGVGVKVDIARIVKAFDYDAFATENGLTD